MKQFIPSYPMITINILAKAKFDETEYKFYFDKNIKKKLEMNEIEKNVYSLEDEDGVWNQSDYDLIIERYFNINNPSDFFGEFGVVCSDSVLGVAIRWSSPNSKMRGVIKIGEINNINEHINLKLNHYIEKGMFRGVLNISTIMFVCKKGIPKNNELHLANEVGMVVGELDSLQLMFDGNGSEFPIYEIKYDDSHKRLWYLEMDWEDPTYDSFDESFSLNLNKNHEKYIFLDKKSSKYDPQLLKEILTMALITMIQKLKENEYWDDITKNQDLTEGSIGKAIYYYISALNWNLDSTENMLESINRFCNEELNL